MLPSAGLADAPESMRDRNVILRLMEAHKLTATRLSERTGYSRSTVFAWRRGARKPTWEACKALCRVFGLTQAKMYEETR